MMQTEQKIIKICTGGGTAADDPTATEAGKTAEWLRENGVDPARILAEDQSITTAQNAIFTFDLLEEHWPQVTRLAIISSDYHIATGALIELSGDAETAL
ncbi:MAG: YdcF family protein [Clostridia bacterium]|nr:YdcF family protein [Clostridia bacterium]